MPRNGTGTMALANTPFSAGTTIDPTPMNGNFSDIVAEITNSVAADGQTAMTGDLNLASHGIKNVTTIGVSGLATLGSIAATGTINTAGAISGASATFTSGARGSGNVHRAVILNDYATNVTSTFNGWLELPNGWYIVSLGGSVPYATSTTTTTAVNLPFTFANSVLTVMACYRGTSPSTDVALAAQPNTLSTVSVTTTGSAAAGSGNVNITIWVIGY